MHMARHKEFDSGKTRSHLRQKRNAIANVAYKFIDSFLSNFRDSQM